MTDVSLVNAVFPTDIKVPPLGLLCLIASLESAGYTADLADYQFTDSPTPAQPVAFADFIDGDTPILGISCMSYALPLVLAAAPIAKGLRPERTIILGGIGPSPVAKRILATCAAVDVVVTGEGEETLVEVVRHLVNGDGRLDDIPGIAYRGPDGNIQFNAERSRIRNLDELPWPAYNRVDLGRYRLVDMQFGRGCPFDCSFCDIAPYWSRRHTRKSVTRFVDELEWLVKSEGASDVFFVDDTFVLSRALVEEICAEIVRRRILCRWGCYARVDLVSERLLACMAEAGCTKVFYGVESGSDATLREIVKATSTARSTEAVRTSLKHIPYVTTSFVWGFPGESLQAVEDTAFLLLYYASLGACPQLNLVLPYSYSDLFIKHQDQLAFFPERSSQLQLYGKSDREWAEDLIRTDPVMYSAFYQVPTSDFEAKWELLDSMGLNPHALQDSFFDQPVGIP